MSARPVLGFICCRRTVGTENAQAVMERYLHGIAPHIGAIPLLIPSLPDLMDADEVVARLDGILLTGSPSNMEPARYGLPDEAGEGPFDAGRDAVSDALIAASLAAGKPVFGICRGFQEINVHFGGTLARDLSTPGRGLEHHAPDGVSFGDMFEHRHPVDIQPGGLLAGLFGTGSLEVNSVHYQGVGTLAPGLRVEARAPDGVVEAFSHPGAGAPVLAVQWHPEWRPDANAQSRALFGLMGDLLRARPAAHGRAA
jgi:putative glutamine amidotransferase